MLPNHLHFDTDKVANMNVQLCCCLWHDRCIAISVQRCLLALGVAGCSQFRV
jgi:hypothetical protein